MDPKDRPGGENPATPVRRANGRGFASMDPAIQRQIASKGGRSVPAHERSFSKDRALAAEAGRKGGEASHGGRRTRPRAGSGTGRPAQG